MHNSTLIADRGTVRVNRAGLSLIQTPAPQGPRHRPVPHELLVDCITNRLAAHDLEIVKEDFAVSAKDGVQLFGVMDLRSHSGIANLVGTDEGFSLGFRSANDRTIAIQIIAGLRIFVCSNMIFSGQSIVLGRKHTTNLSLGSEVDAGITRYVERQRTHINELNESRDHRLTDGRAKAYIYRAFVDKKVLPASYLLDVHRNYFEPKLEWTDITDHPKTVWSLHNAFTRECRRLKPARFFQASQKVGRFMGSILAA